MSDLLPVLPESTSAPEGEAGFGALETDRGPLPLKALAVQARILGLVTRVTVVQTFVNTHREALEAVYIFPLPPRAAVTGFTMRVGGRLVEGKLFERQQARESYARALRDGHRAALAEEDRPNLFTLSVGNLMPGDEAEITFEMAGLLTLEGDEAEWRFPLVAAPRYIPGQVLGLAPAGLGATPDTDQVPDASRLNPPVLLPGYPNPVRLGIDVAWDFAGLPVTGIRSSLHAVTATAEAGRTTIRLAQRERLDRDFILRCRLRPEGIQASAVLVPDDGPSADGGVGTLMVTLLPPVVDPATRPARQVVFLLDRSGSMEGWKILAARRAIARMVDTLGPQDRFEVLTFDTHHQWPGGQGPALVPATDRNRFRALEFLARTEAGGGTETGPAIHQALTHLKGAQPGTEAIVFLVTDGQVGNEDGLLRMVKGSACRFQILGIDEALNDSLLQRLATATGGWFLAAESEDRLDEVLEQASRKFGAPLVTELTLSAPGLAWVPGSLVSSGTRDLYPGTPLVLLGRCQRLPEGLAAEGTLGAGRFKQTLDLATRQEAALRHTWARWRVRDLEDELVRAPEGRVREDLVAISLAHGVLCRFTAFLAVDDAVLANPEGRMATLVQPVESPRGWGHAAQPSMGGAVMCCCLPSGDMDVAMPSILRSVVDAYAPAPTGPTHFDRAATWITGGGPDRLAAALAAAESLLAALAGLDADLALGQSHTGGQAPFPKAFLELARLLKGRGIPPSSALKVVRRLLKEAQAGQLVLVGALVDALERFLAEHGSARVVQGARTFWAP